MTASLYTRAQQAIADLKGAVYELLAASNTPLSNAEIGRRLGIYHGHVGHEGHISRTVLKLLETDEVIVQDRKTKAWQLRDRATVTPPTFNRRRKSSSVRQAAP